MMPKISEARRDERRQQILDAGLRCFSRDGFHATTTADIVREAGVKAGTAFDPHLDTGFFQQVDRSRNGGDAAFGWESFFEYTNSDCQRERTFLMISNAGRAVY